MQSDIPLLLAPAGSFDALIAACAAGADAVYLGGRQFGARQYASNFSDEELEAAVRYAHLRGVLVYVTVNTLITEKEIPKVLDFLLFIYRIGVDAVIIQDIGLVSLVRKAMPGLTLHASTQMGIHNSAGAIYAAQRGCKRIVLAREIPGEEIQQIADSILTFDVDLEVFAHGALCYAYSGRCLLSALIGGRSGNRGMCAQPCRKQYELVRGEPDPWGRIERFESAGIEGYLLSTKDLQTYQVLDSICSLPVAALKIEGRMRSPEYVAIVVSIYRRALDAIRAGTFHPDLLDSGHLALAFSRGFTSGYISGSDCSEVMGRVYPGNQGFYLGEVVGYQTGIARIKPYGQIIPEAGDGLVIRDKQRSEGLVLRYPPSMKNGILDIPAPFHPAKGSQVFITKRRELEIRIADLLSNPDKRYIGALKITCSITFSPDGHLSAEGEVQDLFSHRHHFRYCELEKVEPAKTRALTKDQIYEQLHKTGGTIFSFNKIVITGEEGWFAPIRVLNSLRRGILSAAETVVISSYLPDPSTVHSAQEKVFDMKNISIQSSEKVIPIPSLITIVSSTSEADSALRGGADQVYIIWPVSWTDSYKIFQYPNRLGLFIPGVIRQNLLASLMEDIQDLYLSGLRLVMVDSVGIGEHIKERFSEMLVCSYYGLPITNSVAVLSCNQFEFCTLSPELSEREIKDVRSIWRDKITPDLAVVCQGLIEAMVTEDNLCSLIPPDLAGYALRDEKNYLFPFYCDSSGRTHILNSFEHSLAGEFSSLMADGIRFYIIDGRLRGERYAGEMTRLWKAVINESAGIDDIKEKILRISYGGVTRSGYNRGLSGMR